MFLSSPYTITTYSIGFLMPLVFMKEMGNNKKYVSLSVLPYLAGKFISLSVLPYLAGKYISLSVLPYLAGKYVSLSVLPYLAGIFMDTFSVDVYM